MAIQLLLSSRRESGRSSCFPKKDRTAWLDPSINRATNPIESTFATVRHRTRQTKGNGSRQATLAMVFQLLRQAEGKWRKLNGSHQLDKIIAGVIFIDGDEQKQQAA